MNIRSSLDFLPKLSVLKKIDDARPEVARDLMHDPQAAITSVRKQRKQTAGTAKQSNFPDPEQHRHNLYQHSGSLDSAIRASISDNRKNADVYDSTYSSSRRDRYYILTSPPKTKTSTGGAPCTEATPMQSRTSKPVPAMARQRTFGARPFSFQRLVSPLYGRLSLSAQLKEFSTTAFIPGMLLGYADAIVAFTTKLELVLRLVLTEAPVRAMS